jgi:hypothetical protein
MLFCTGVPGKTHSSPKGVLVAQKINEHQLGEVLFRSLMHMNTEGSSLEHHLALREAETPLAASTQKQWARSVVTRFYERLNANREARMDRQDLQALFMLYPKLSRRLLFGGQIIEKDAGRAEADPQASAAAFDEARRLDASSGHDSAPKAAFERSAADVEEPHDRGARLASGHRMRRR